MPTPLTATPVSPGSLAATAVPVLGGTFPGANTFPGASTFPGRGTSLGVVAVSPSVLTAATA
jgi:hypothetical protein